jgi:hypothetical protein
VVATAGDVVEVKDRGTLYINGVAQPEDFAFEKVRYKRKGTGGCKVEGFEC